MSDQWGPDEYPNHNPPPPLSPKRRVQRRAYVIFCTIFTVGGIGTALTFAAPWNAIFIVVFVIAYLLAIQSDSFYID